MGKYFKSLSSLATVAVAALRMVMAEKAADEAKGETIDMQEECFVVERRDNHSSFLLLSH